MADLGTVELVDVPVYAVTLYSTPMIGYTRGTFQPIGETVQSIEKFAIGGTSIPAAGGGGGSSAPTTGQVWPSPAGSGGSSHEGLYDPIGTAAASMTAHVSTTDPHTGYQLESEKGANNGYASLDSTGKVPAIQLPASSGGSLPSRTTTSFTTSSISPNSHATGTVTLAKGYRLYRLMTSVPARVRLYTQSSRVSSDLTRPIGTDVTPATDHGLQFEYVTVDGMESAALSPTVDGFNEESTPNANIPYSVTNLDNVEATITVTLTWVQTEA